MNIMLNELLPEETNVPDIAIRGLSIDSRAVREGDLFIAMPGAKTDGRKYIEQVADKAVCVICEPPRPEVSVGIPVFPVTALAEKVGAIASRFYGNPSERMQVVAITGTNGKTSCSHFIAQCLDTLGEKSAVIGTMGYGPSGMLKANSLTTPDPVSIQKMLAELLAESCGVVTIEASSHGLSQHRLNGTRVAVAVLTNVTRDHLDYHESFEHYKAAKLRLFEMSTLKTAVLNSDDPFSEEITNSLNDAVNVVTYSAGKATADVCCRDLVFDMNGLRFTLKTPWGEAKIRSPLMGRFNIANMLATAAVLGSQGFEIKKIAIALNELDVVSGRMEVIKHPKLPTVVIDYAHTPDALEKALLGIREHTRAELWCVFGCGGERDKGKRSQMGEIASRLANHVVITDDNPRGEPSMAIARDVARGVIGGADVEIETNRRLAIRKVLANAAIKDVVLIAGKGHEQYQETAKGRIEYSDHSVVQEYCG